MKWRFSAPAGDVEGSKLCLFSVIMPAKCLSGSLDPGYLKIAHVVLRNVNRVNHWGYTERVEGGGLTKSGKHPHSIPTQ
jgi:hypothetical protein